jgi:hypothetical protein
MAKPPKPKKAAKKPATVSKNSPAKAVKKIDRRGTPKGKGTVTKTGRGKAGRIGNPPFVATDEQRLVVRTHAACGTPHWLIAEILTPPCSLSTLEKHFRNELDTGLLQVNARMASLIAKQALTGCRTSQRFWMQTRGGWGVKTTTELTGPDGGALQLAAAPRNPNLRLLSDEELEAYERFQAKLEGLPDASDS